MPESQPPAAPTPGPWVAIEPYKGRWCVRAPRLPSKDNPRDFFAVVAAVGGDRSQHEANAKLIAAALLLAHAARALIQEHENLEDRAPSCAKCGSCNLGTGPHLRYCAYHAAKIAIAKIDGAAPAPHAHPRVEA